jgi:capsular exopolysaccharide synthesis family protein
MAFLAPDHAISTVAVTSAVAEEGKSTVGAWYASVSAAAGTRTLIVDCDFRKPRLAARLGVDSKPGLSDYLAGGAAAGDVVRVVDVQGPDAVPLSFIPAGSPLFQPAETIASRKFRQFVREIADVYELVIFDTAPLLPVSDTLQLIPQIDAIVLCVRIGQTTRTQAHAAKGALSHLPTKPTGVVVTSVTRGDDYYYYGDYPVGASRVRGEPTSG